MATEFYEWKFGDVFYLKRGWGEPIVLLHNIYPGASHEEFEHNVAELARHFTVYAVDLLGFGRSDAPRLRYTANLYATLIHDFLVDVVGQPAHVVAAGLTCSYVADVAVWRHELVKSIAMLCPRSEPIGLDSPRWIAAIRHFLISSPTLGHGMYETLSSVFEVDAFLRGCFHNPKHITRPKIDRLTANASQPGGAFPYASLVSGYLDSPLMRALPHVSMPTLLIWGREAKPTPVEHSVRLAAMLRKGQLHVVEQAGAWVHDEQSNIVNKLLCDFALNRGSGVAAETA